MRPVIIVFAKSPEGGPVKTRLCLPPSEAMRLHTAFVSDTLEQLLGLGLADVELHTDTPSDAWTHIPVPRHLQSGASLNERMRRALTSALSQGRPAVLLTGSDAPTVPSSYYKELISAPEDIALGPADDGGYYAIGARRTHPRMFDGAATSTPETLAQTTAALRACGLSIHLGRMWFDIDTPADLERLRNSAQLPRFTRAALELT